MTLVSGDQITEANAGELEAGDWLLTRQGLVLRFVYEDKHGFLFCDGFGGEHDRDAHHMDAFTFLGRPDADGWIEWHGGENPVPGQMVEVRYHGGREVVTCSDVQDWTWLHTTVRDDDDIIAYRPAPSAVETPSAAGEGVYVASRASVPERSAMWRMHRSHGQTITSTWIDEAELGSTRDLGELWSRIEREVTSSRALILYAAKDDFPLKGAFVEVGMALAAKVPVFVVVDGVELEPRSMRPLGSWAHHPLVSFAESVSEAFRQALHAGEAK